ncbi:MAG TPA: YebC/PmpR family DNA-binding transcriptional regulator [Phycisphaerae bacterium]|nr:YebC/PmpR family DNA-binding transcriptional regulator [Phycisphaerae bacterium]
MAGHSHWAKIKRSKAAVDAKRGKVWSKLARRIIVAAKHGGGKPEENLQLRYAIDEAKAANMPNDTIDKAIKKGTGELGSETYEEVVYEGYAAGGVAVMVEALTDNRNRTAPEMRKLFERSGGQLGASNSVAWMFDRKGTFAVAAEMADEDTLMEIALEAGADDVRLEGDSFEITCQVAAFSAVRQALADRKIETVSAEIAMVPKSTISVEGEKARQVLALVESLEDHDDVQHVYANFDIPDSALAELDRQG